MLGGAAIILAKSAPVYTIGGGRAIIGGRFSKTSNSLSFEWRLNSDAKNPVILLQKTPKVVRLGSRSMPGGNSRGILVTGMSTTLVTLCTQQQGSSTHLFLSAIFPHLYSNSESSFTTRGPSLREANHTAEASSERVGSLQQLLFLCHAPYYTEEDDSHVRLSSFLVHIAYVWQQFCVINCICFDHRPDLACCAWKKAIRLVNIPYITRHLGIQDVNNTGDIMYIATGVQFSSPPFRHFPSSLQQF
ncbi:hypothetical protein COLO4_14891 [Corchorus olitorius]|uniref:Uncharacterized protein n=1 Tax=Corchorus olitorius TaxID=93759 RepID=A0A1R3JQK3_9ROSI|nr:hypothetical protein COLO4_14891 [Corchorus olitorius]